MSSPSLSFLRVLIVVDDEAYVRLLGAWLDVRPRHFGVHVEIAKRVGDAVQLLELVHEFDAVAVDVTPDGAIKRSPAEILEQLADAANCPPIVALTNVELDWSTEALEAGAVDFSLKASGPERLESLLRSLYHAALRHRMHMERDDLLEHVRAHNTRLERLARVLAHDLRMPITVALAAVETSQRFLERGDVTDAETHLTMAHRRLLDLSGQMEKVLDETIMGHTSGGVAVSPSETAELAYLAMPVADRERLTLLTVDGPDVIAMPGTLRQIFQNLLANAINHNPGDVVVRVETKAQGPLSIIVVEDNGVGWQGDTDDLALEGVSTAGSSGIGLSTVRSAAESLGGRAVFLDAASGGARIQLHLRTAVDQPEPSASRNLSMAQSTPIA